MLHLVMYVVFAVLSAASNKLPCFFERFHLSLLFNGYTESFVDYAIFYRASPEGIVLLQLYIDDIIITERSYYYYLFEAVSSELV